MLRAPEQTAPERIDALVLRCLGRWPSAAERSVLTELFESLRRQYREAPEAATALAGTSPGVAAPREEIAAWIGVARVIMNTDNFTSRE